MWSLFQDSKLWHCRPSSMVDIQDPYVAYCFDQAVSIWGGYVERELDKIEGKNEKQVATKRRNKLMQLLEASDKQRFRSPRPKKPTKPV